MAARSKVRLFVEHPLGPGQSVGLTEPQAHYLFGVMRLGPGDSLTLFNGRDGEWQAEVVEAARRRGSLRSTVRTAPQALPPDVWLVFAPLKKARTDFIVEKAAELGVRRILPVATTFTGAERVNRDRLQAHAVEAAEQCGGVFVPEVAEMAPLAGVLAGWDPARRMMWCDEGLAGRPAAAADAATLAAALGRGGPAAVLTGPEGGFSDAERAQLAALPFVVPVRLGPRILRADTAAVAALAVWQLACGDWAGT
jgi:16S rRNA (uracil1498-N3)-methyltransferase